jgi:hypothetical protein
MESNQLQNLLLVVNEQGAQIYARASGEVFIRSFVTVIEKQTLVAKRSGILISTLWTANALSRRIGLSQVPRGSLKVIDTVSMRIGSSIARSDDIVFLASPPSLESILVAVERQLLERKGERTFLILDSLSSLSRRFSRGELDDFFTYLLNRMLEEEITVIVFDQFSDGEDGPVADIAAMMDHRFDLSKEGA